MLSFIIHIDNNNPATVDNVFLQALLSNETFNSFQQHTPVCSCDCSSGKCYRKLHRKIAGKLFDPCKSFFYTLLFRNIVFQLFLNHFQIIFHIFDFFCVNSLYRRQRFKQFVNYALIIDRFALFFKAVLIFV